MVLDPTKNSMTVSDYYRLIILPASLSVKSKCKPRDYKITFRVKRVFNTAKNMNEYINTIINKVYISCLQRFANCVKAADFSRRAPRKSTAGYHSM